VASGSRGWTNTLLPRHSILYDELPAATSMTGSASSMMLKWFGAVSTRITLCRSDFSVSILWAWAAAQWRWRKRWFGHAQVSTDSCIAPKRRQPRHRSRLPTKAGGQLPGDWTHTHLLKPGGNHGHRCLAGVAEFGGNSKTFGVLHGNFEAEAACQKGLEGGDIQLGKTGSWIENREFGVHGVHFRFANYPVFNGLLSPCS